MTELIAFLLVSVIILAAALLISGRRGGVRMFVSADGNLPWAACGLSLFISFFSAGTFVAWGAVAYRDGLVAVTIQETMCLAGLAVGLLIAPRWRALNVTTVAGYLSDRFGVRVQRAYTLLFFFVSFFSAAAFLYPVARILSFSWGLDARLGVVLLGILCMLYVSTGGLWSVVLTDVIQFVILTAVVLIAAPLSLPAAWMLSWPMRRKASCLRSAKASPGCSSWRFSCTTWCTWAAAGLSCSVTGRSGSRETRARLPCCSRPCIWSAPCCGCCLRWCAA